MKASGNANVFYYIFILLPGGIAVFIILAINTGLSNDNPKLSSSDVVTSVLTIRARYHTEGAVQRHRGRGRKLQFSDGIPINSYKFLTEKITNAQNFNFAFKFFQNVFYLQSLNFWANIFWQKRFPEKFFGQPKI